MTTGTLHDTYHAALQHDHVEPDDDDLVLGVVRKPIYGITDYLDANWRPLAPPQELLDEFKATARHTGHNDAVEAVDFKERYRDHLTNHRQQERLHTIVEQLESGRDVWLVCYENTDDKFCHRELLVDNIEDRLSQS